MKITQITKLAEPLPLDEIAEEYGGRVIDNGLDDQIISWLENKYSFERKIGEGMLGIAYLTTDGKVVKITSSSEEYKMALDLMEPNYGPFVKIYDAYPLKGTKLFVIVKQKVKILNDDQRMFFDNVFEYSEYAESLEKLFSKNIMKITEQDILNVYLSGNLGLMESINRAVVISKKAHLEMSAEQWTKEIYGSVLHIQEHSGFMEQAMDFINEVANYNINDVKGNNVGFDDYNNIVAFDFGQ